MTPNSPTPRLRVAVVRSDDPMDIRRWARTYLSTILVTEGLAGTYEQELNHAS